jgi:flagellar hook-length control protein FliK
LVHSKFGNPGYLFSDIINVNESNTSEVVSESDSKFSSFLLGNANTKATESSQSNLLAEKVFENGYRLNKEAVDNFVENLIHNAKSVEIDGQKIVLNDFDKSTPDTMLLLASKLSGTKPVELKVENSTSSLTVEVQNYSAIVKPAGIEKANFIINNEEKIKFSEIQKLLKQFVSNVESINDKQFNVPFDTKLQLKDIIAKFIGNKNNSENHFVNQDDFIKELKELAFTIDVESLDLSAHEKSVVKLITEFDNENKISSDLISFNEKVTESLLNKIEGELVNTEAVISHTQDQKHLSNVLKLINQLPEEEAKKVFQFINIANIKLDSGLSNQLQKIVNSSEEVEIFELEKFVSSLNSDQLKSLDAEIKSVLLTSGDEETLPQDQKHLSNVLKLINQLPEEEAKKVFQFINIANIKLDSSLSNQLWEIVSSSEEVEIFELEKFVSSLNSDQLKSLNAEIKRVILTSGEEETLPLASILNSVLQDKVKLHNYFDGNNVANLENKVLNELLKVDNTPESITKFVSNLTPKDRNILFNSLLKAPSSNTNLNISSKTQKLFTTEELIKVITQSPDSITKLLPELKSSEQLVLNNIQNLLKDDRIINILNERLHSVLPNFNKQLKPDAEIKGNTLTADKGLESTKSWFTKPTTAPIVDKTNFEKLNISEPAKIGKNSSELTKENSSTITSSKASDADVIAKNAISELKSTLKSSDKSFNQQIEKFITKLNNLPADYKNELVNNEQLKPMLNAAIARLKTVNAPNEQLKDQLQKLVTLPLVNNKKPMQNVDKPEAPRVVLPKKDITNDSENLVKVTRTNQQENNVHVNSPNNSSKFAKLIGSIKKDDSQFVLKVIDQKEIVNREQNQLKELITKQPEVSKERSFSNLSDLVRRELNVNSKVSIDSGDAKQSLNTNQNNLLKNSGEVLYSPKKAVAITDYKPNFVNPDFEKPLANISNEEQSNIEKLRSENGKELSENNSKKENHTINSKFSFANKPSLNDNKPILKWAEDIKTNNVSNLNNEISPLKEAPKIVEIPTSTNDIKQTEIKTENDVKISNTSMNSNASSEQQSMNNSSQHGSNSFNENKYNPDLSVKLNSVNDNSFNKSLETEQQIRTNIQQRVEVIKDVQLQSVNSKIEAAIVTRESQAITLKLNPQSLGKIDIALEVKENIVNANIEVENEVVRQSVQANIEQLRQALTQQGLNPQSLNVSLANSDDKGNKFYKNSKKRNQHDKEVELGNNIEQEAPKKMGYNTYDFVA